MLAGCSLTRSVRLTYIGHATVLIEVDGARLLTDPLLRNRLGPLRARRGRVDPAGWGGLDAVLLSHFHRDHFDARSLAILDPTTLMIGPPGSTARLRRLSFRNVAELRPGETVEVAGVGVRATPAEHGRTPKPVRRTALGFVVAGSITAYFAGDTDLFPEMAELAADRLDVALLPIGGWGPCLGSGHLDPLRAAKALQLVRPRLAVPVHWGVLHPLGVGWMSLRYLTEPPRAFAGLVAELAPEVEVRILQPGDTLEV